MTAKTFRFSASVDRKKYLAAVHAEGAEIVIP